MKPIKLLYWISTGLLTMLMLYSAQMYFFNYEGISQAFQFLGFPQWMIYPLATAKILGLIAIWSRLSSFLKEWAYAGFFFDTIMALTAHQMTDGGGLFAVLGIIFVVVSYVTDGKLHGNAAFSLNE